MVIMVKSFQTIIFLFSFLLFGCAKNSVKKEPAHALFSLAPLEKVALEVEVEAIPNSHRIVGSSKIRENGIHGDKKTYFLYGAEHLKLENYYFDFPVVYNKSVKKWINYFLNRGRGFFERYSARAGHYAPLLSKILHEYGLPRDLIFLAMAESGFRANAKSWAKAVGPWQFMPYTGKRFGLKIDWYMDERRDPIKSTIAAAKYLTKLFSMYGSWELAAAAYNAGEGKMNRAIRRYRTENFWKIRRGRYLKPETKNYVPKIMALAILGKNLRSFGFADIDFHDPLDFDEITIGPGVDLMLLSEAMGADFAEIKRLNPELLRWFTPLNIESYVLRIPQGMKKNYVSCCKDESYNATAFQPYKIKGRRATLKQIAKKFKIKPYVLKELNNLAINRYLKRGTEVHIPFRIGQSKRDPMYSDLYEKPRKSVRRRRKYRRQIARAKRKGKVIASPTTFYTVKRGDTLWDVSRKTGVGLMTLMRTNMRLVQNRMIRAGDKLAIR
jgi:membrane-bound lytic murein transglycosylase D